MAYINKQTFDIIRDSNDDSVLEEYFECDDAIAMTISELNLKGYTTKFCCAGHPFPDYSYSDVYTHGLLKDPYSVAPGTERAEYNEETGVLRVYCRQLLATGIYIMFAENVFISEVPKGFTYDPIFNVLRRKVRAKGPVSFQRTCLEWNIKLLDWACSLPEADPEEMARQYKEARAMHTVSTDKYDAWQTLDFEISVRFKAGLSSGVTIFCDEMYSPEEMRNIIDRALTGVDEEISLEGQVIIPFPEIVGASQNDNTSCP